VNPQWPLRSEIEFLAWYDATIEQAFRYSASLCRNDSAMVADLVQDAYFSVFRRVRRRAIEVGTAGLITTAIRNRFIDLLRSSETEQRKLSLLYAATRDAGSQVDDPYGRPSRA
jgi:DNA-directed RNA polymerase specialized sigma24 family protein